MLTLTSVCLGCVKKAKAKTKESIKTAKLMMENEKIEEQGKQEIEFSFGEVVKDSSTQTCNTSETSNNEQNLQAEWLKKSLQDFEQNLQCRPLKIYSG